MHVFVLIGRFAVVSKCMDRCRRESNIAVYSTLLRRIHTALLSKERVPVYLCPWFYPQDDFPGEMVETFALMAQALSYTNVGGRT
jgi:hypothetical protein